MFGEHTPAGALVKATPVRRQEKIKKNAVWDTSSRLEMVWPLTGIAEVSYSWSFEHSKVSILGNSLL